jgi:TRAP-type C4-dicarboxylate transport system permease small subunit
VVERLSLIPKGLGVINQLLVSLVKYAIAINLAVMVGIVFYAVLSRNVLNASIAWAEEASRILFIWLVFSGAVLALFYKEHLGLSLLIDRLNPKFQVLFEMVSWTLIIVINRAMIIGGHRIVDVIKVSRTPALNLPTSLKYLPVLIAGYLMILIASEHLMNSIKRACTLFARKAERGNA